MAITHNNRGGYYWVHGDKDLARNDFTQALEILIESLGKINPMVDVVTSNLRLLEGGASHFQPLFHDSHIGFSPERGFEVLPDYY